MNEMQHFCCLCQTCFNTFNVPVCGLTFKQTAWQAVWDSQVLVNSVLITSCKYVNIYSRHFMNDHKQLVNNMLSSLIDQLSSSPY